MAWEITAESFYYRFSFQAFEEAAVVTVHGYRGKEALPKMIRAKVNLFPAVDEHKGLS